MGAPRAAPPQSPRGLALTSATLGLGRGAEPWRAARGEGAGLLGSSGRRPERGANVEAAASRGATRTLTAAMAAPGLHGRRVKRQKSSARRPAAPAHFHRPGPAPASAPVGGAALAQSPPPPRERAGGRGRACAVLLPRGCVGSRTGSLPFWARLCRPRVWSPPLSRTLPSRLL